MDPTKHFQNYSEDMDQNLIVDFYVCFQFHSVTAIMTTDVSNWIGLSDSLDILSYSLYFCERETMELSANESFFIWLLYL